jgi:hypothetical protein
MAQIRGSVKVGNRNGSRLFESGFDGGSLLAASSNLVHDVGNSDHNEEKGQS